MVHSDSSFTSALSHSHRELLAFGSSPCLIFSLAEIERTQNYYDRLL
jgi:hypothetical protein